MRELPDYGRGGPPKENHGPVLEAGRCRHGCLSRLGSPGVGGGRVWDSNATSYFILLVSEALEPECLGSNPRSAPCQLVTLSHVKSLEAEPEWGRMGSEEESISIRN